MDGTDQTNQQAKHDCHLLLIGGSLGQMSLTWSHHDGCDGGDGDVDDVGCVFLVVVVFESLLSMRLRSR